MAGAEGRSSRTTRGFPEQIYLDNSPGGINAFAAWDLSTGATSVVVAVVDSGLTNHVELSGRTVPGYDFIADPKAANDGDGRDPIRPTRATG